MLGVTKLQDTRFYQEAKEEGRVEGRVEGQVQEARSLILKLLTRRFGELPQPLTAQLETLSLPQLEALTEVLLDFQTLEDLESWLSETIG